MASHQYVQSEITECGLVALAIALSELGQHVSLPEMRLMHSISSRGSSIADLMAMSRKHQLVARPVKCELNELRHLQTPVILHWDLCHFVVLTRYKQGKYYIRDPAGFSNWLNLEQINSRFTGVALELSRAPHFERKRPQRDFSVWRSFRIRGIATTPLIQAIIFSLFLQILLLISPYYGQLAIDNAASTGDEDFALILGAAFAIAALFAWAADALRGYMSNLVSMLVGWDLSLRLFSHMIKLPQRWFDRREATDTMLRYESITPIKQLISGTFISSALDGVFSTILLAVMINYSAQLTIVSCLGVALALLLRIATIKMSLRLSSESLIAEIKEKSSRLEIVKSMQTIKLAQAEAGRLGQWSNELYDQSSKQLKSSTFSNIITSTNNLASQLFLIIVIFLASSKIGQGEMTAGGVFAFIAYRQQFSQRMSTLFEMLISWRLTEIHSDRIGEIVSTPLDNNDGHALSLPFSGISFSNICFRFSDLDPFIIYGASGEISPGEMVGILGPSGCGKSTLLKILCALYDPSGGLISMSSTPYALLGREKVRSNISAVLQSDELLTGTIIDNIAMFDPNPNRERIWESLEVADFADFVRSLPMGLDSHVGDMGRSLSAGQKQRIMISRCIYRDTPVIVLDEATSNLDEASEERILRSIKKTGKTIIAVSHRSTMEDLCDKKIKLGHKLSLPAQHG